MVKTDCFIHILLADGLTLLWHIMLMITKFWLCICTKLPLIVLSVIHICTCVLFLWVLYLCYRVMCVCGMFHESCRFQNSGGWVVCILIVLNLTWWHDEKKLSQKFTFKIVQDNSQRVVNVCSLTVAFADHKSITSSKCMCKFPQLSCGMC